MPEFEPGDFVINKLRDKFVIISLESPDNIQLKLLRTRVTSKIDFNELNNFIKLRVGDQWLTFQNEIVTITDILDDVPDQVDTNKGIRNTFNLRTLQIK